MSTARLILPALLLGTLAAPSAAQSSMEIVVNIAAGRLDVFQGTERIRSYPVSVGMPRYATPTGSADIRQMIWNPSWTPPPDAEWAREEKAAPPGWGNPMGRVKMHLFDDYYIHGTPRSNEVRIGRPASHGCIRMRNRDAMELAQLVLRADGAPLSDAAVQSLIRNPGNTRELALRGRVHVRVEYRLAEVDDYSVTLLPDVYARSGDRYHQDVQAELQRRGTVLDPMLAGLRVSGQALRFGRMDVSRPVRVDGAIARSPAERIRLRASAPELLASNAQPSM